MMSKHKFILLVFVCLAWGKLYSQNIDYKTVEELTLRFYNETNYDSLIIVGKQGLNLEMDYFYLRYRLGVAYYAKGKFREAVTQFFKARGFNSSDEYTLEYLYYSYVEAGMEQEALYLAKEFSESMRKRINVKNATHLSNVYFETGGSYFENTENNISKIKQPLAPIGSIKYYYGQGNVTLYSLYGHLGVKSYITPSINFYIGYSFLDIFVNQQVGNLDTTILNINNNFYQNQLYINSNIRIAKTLTLTTAFHFIRVDLPYETINKNDTTKTLNNYCASISINKGFKLFDIGLALTYSNLNDQYQQQIIGSFTLFPFKNLNLYFNTNFTVMFQGGKKQWFNYNRLIFDETIGVKISKKIWSEVNFAIGNMNNVNEKNAFVVYNYSDNSKLRAGLAFIFPITKHLELSLRYQFFMKELNYLYYEDADSMGLYSGNGTETYKTLNYNNHNIIGGLKWKL